MTAKSFIITLGILCFFYTSFLLIKNLAPYFNGEFTYAKVSDVSEELSLIPGRRNRNKTIVIHYYYQYNNQTYTGSCDPDFGKNRYGIGDSLLIKFSPNNPSNAIILENYEFKLVLLTIGWVVSIMITFGLYKWG